MRETQIPDTKYADLDGDKIAYQVFGGGGVDILYMSLVTECIDLRWDLPAYVEFFARFAKSGRVITFDARGCGASDEPSSEGLPSWERWAAEADAVLAAVGSERAVVVATINASAAAVLYAATHPEQTRGLVLVNGTARIAAADDYPFGIPAELMALNTQFIDSTWGTASLADFSPDIGGDPLFRRWVARNQRLFLSPRSAARFMSEAAGLDVRDALPLVRVPTLVIHREGVQPVGIEHGRYLAEHIPGARLVVVPGNDGNIFSPPHEPINDAIEQFVGELTQPVSSDRALAAVLFTDIVDSTALAAAMGDTSWRRLLETHDAVTRALVEQHRGRLVKTTGDGLLATFDGPGRALAAVTAMRAALRPFNIEIRAGLHTGEIELRGDDIAGIGVHIAARVLSHAEPGEVWVSAAVPMLVAGSGLEFKERGQYELKGVPGQWQLHSLLD